MPRRQKTKKRISKRSKHTIKRVSAIKPVITGGKYIAKGTYGCVFKPQLPCNGNPVTKVGQVSKLIAAYNESGEMAAKKLFEGIDPSMNYFVYPKKSCIPAELAENNRNTRNNISKCTIINRTTGKELSQNYSTDKRRLVQMENGGNILTKLQLSAKDYIPYFKSLSDLLKGLKLAHDNNITHNDIKYNNVVSKKKEDGTFTTRFIDLGLSCKTDEFSKLSPHNQFILFNRFLISRPFDIRFMVDRYITCYTDNSDPDNTVDCEYENEFSGFSPNISGSDLNKYYKYLLGTKDEKFGNVTNVDTFYNFINAEDVDVSFPKQYILHNFVYKNDKKLADIMKDVYAKPKEERYRFVMTRFDIFGLGLYLSNIYYQKVGHFWLAKEKGELHTIYLRAKKDHIPLLELRDGEIKRKEYASLSKAYQIITENVYNIHTDIALNVSVPYFNLVSGMMHPNILERESLDDAISKYGEILKKINEYFKEEKILQFGHRELAFDQTIEQIINEEAEAAYAKAELQRLLTEYKSKQQEIGVIKQNIQRLLVTKNTIEKNIKTYKAISKSTKNSIDKWPENKETPNRILQLEQLEIKIQEFEEEFNTISQKLDDENSKFTQLEKQINDIVETHNSLLAELNKLMKKK